MKRCHVAAREIFPALHAEAFHAESASEVVAVPSFLDHLVTVRAHLKVLAFGGFIVQFIEMLFAREASVPVFFGKVAKLIVTCFALHLIFVGVL